MHGHAISKQAASETLVQRAMVAEIGDCNAMGCTCQHSIIDGRRTSQCAATVSTDGLSRLVRSVGSSMIAPVLYGTSMAVPPPADIEQPHGARLSLLQIQNISSKSPGPPYNSQ